MTSVIVRLHSKVHTYDLDQCQINRTRELGVEGLAEAQKVRRKKVH